MWSMTKTELQRNIETMVTRRSGQTALTHVEKLIISDAINAAMVDICTQVGLDTLKPIRTDTTATTTASTNYVDLDSEVLRIVSGTVRIEAEDTYLAEMSLSDFYILDPGEDSEGTPTRYCLTYNGTTPRLLLRDIPDQEYTIALTVEEIVDEDSLSSFMGWLHGLLSARAIQLAFEDLAIDSSHHERQYRQRLQNVRNTLKTEQGPRHVRAVSYRVPTRDLESYRP